MFSEPAATCCAAPGPTTTISTLTPFRLNHPNSLAMYSGHCSAPLLTKPSMILVSACAGCGEPARTLRIAAAENAPARRIFRVKATIIVTSSLLALGRGTLGVGRDKADIAGG